MTYLYDTLANEFGKRNIKNVEVPGTVRDNLRHELRPYQVEAFQRFILCQRESFEGKPKPPLHLLYSMATGSGKTLVMAGLILHLYEKGYRNVLFFVNSTNIIKKTKDNFLNPHAAKYLFKDRLTIDGQGIHVREVENFEEADTENINIKFTTIQQLHTDLTQTRENRVTLEELADKKILLIADEAHHLSAGTKSQLDALEGSWEGTVMNILEANSDNILLEFTATVDYERPEIAEKYRDKVIFRYDLSKFREDKYSKEINLFRSDNEEQVRIIQALLLNLYRQELAGEHYINLKPVILFKAKRTIQESEENKARFHQLIDNLSAEQVDNVQNSAPAILKKAFRFFNAKGLSSIDIAARLKNNFREENCLSANNESEAEQNQIRLNTLEDEDNPIRAVFAVQKLNEGWDVLNLFDIVRLYEGRDSKSGKPGKTTIAEAQLIGRGARYFPFILEEGQDRYQRKFDDDRTNDLKVLEELYYHAREDNRYISELKIALIETGIYEDEANLETRQLTLKPAFKETDLYKTGRVIFNKKKAKSYDNVTSIADLGVSRQNFKHTLASGHSTVSAAFGGGEEDKNQASVEQKDISLAEIPKHVVHYALTQNPFYHFSSLRQYFPNNNSLSDFITSENYLGGLKITFQGTESRLQNIANKDYLQAVSGLLGAIEAEIKANLTEYEGTPYKSEYLRKVFKDKEIRVSKDSERAKGQENLVSEPAWYAYNANYGTDQEKAFVAMFARQVEDLEKKYSEIYLVRNERDLKLYDEKGRAFEPDFVLFCEQENGEKLAYQVFVEPKGAHLAEHDRWKEDYLRKLAKDDNTFRGEDKDYRVTGVPFYNSEKENEFIAALKEALPY